MPDASIIGTESRLHTINEIAHVTNKPIIVDGDTGGEIPQFEFLITNLERLGVSSVIIEDKVFPKRNSLDTSARQELENQDIFANKIKSGINKKTNPYILLLYIKKPLYIAIILIIWIGYLNHLINYFK